MKRLLCFLLFSLLLWGCGTSASSVKKEKPHGYLQEGTALLKKGDTTEAIRVFQQAMLQNPQNPQPPYILGQLYMHLSHYDVAGRYFQRVIAVDPDNGQAYLLLGGCYDLQGKRTQAIKSVEKSAEIFQRKKDKENLEESLVILRRLVESRNTPN